MTTLRHYRGNLSSFGVLERVLFILECKKRTENDRIYLDKLGPLIMCYAYSIKYIWNRVFFVKNDKQ